MKYFPMGYTTYTQKWQVEQNLLVLRQYQQLWIEYVRPNIEYKVIVKTTYSALRPHKVLLVESGTIRSKRRDNMINKQFEYPTQHLLAPFSPQIINFKLSNEHIAVKILSSKCEVIKCSISSSSVCVFRFIECEHRLGLNQRNFTELNFSFNFPVDFQNRYLYSKNLKYSAQPRQKPQSQGNHGQSRHERSVCWFTQIREIRSLLLCG